MGFAPFAQGEGWASPFRLKRGRFYRVAARRRQETHPHCENTTIEMAARIAESVRYVRLNAF